MLALGEISYYILMNYDDFYEVLEQLENTVKIRLCGNEHPIFKAHFPTQPILPGFVHFDLIEKLFSLDIQTIKKAKFIEMILPNEELRYERKENSFKVFNAQKEVANFSIQTI